MLTADLVHARRHKGELRLQPLKPEQKARAKEIAAQLLDLAHAHVGQTREELQESWKAVRVGAREQRLAAGIRKLVEDGLDFEVGAEHDPILLRRTVFERATARRKELEEHERLERDTVLDEVAEERGLSSEALDAALYADLKGAHVLKGVSAPSAVAMVRGYDLQQARAVLLKAVRLSVWIRGASPDGVRLLFRKLKFQRLLHTIHREPDGVLRIDIDGPYSLFDSVTKYGLALANALPAITAAGAWSVEAEVRWGKQRTPLIFKLEGEPRGEQDDVHLRDDVATLLERFNAAKKSGWTAQVAEDVIDLPGVGLCVPDLVFTNRESGETVLLEVLGFWSREAVWRRVELVEAGIHEKILFAVSSRLRVSEAVLDDDLPGALYVYKGTMSKKQIERKLDALIEPR